MTAACPPWAPHSGARLAVTHAQTRCQTSRHASSDTLLTHLSESEGACVREPSVRSGRPSSRSCLRCSSGALLPLPQCCSSPEKSFGAIGHRQEPHTSDEGHRLSLLTRRAGREPRAPPTGAGVSGGPGQRFRKGVVPGRRSADSAGTHHHQRPADTAVDPNDGRRSGSPRRHQAELPYTRSSCC